MDYDSDNSYSSSESENKQVYPPTSRQNQITCKNLMKKIILNDQRKLCRDRDSALMQLVNISTEENILNGENNIENIIEDVCQAMDQNVDLSPDSIQLLKYYSNLFLIDLFEKTNEKAKEDRKYTVFPKHMQAAVSDMKNSGKICPFTCIEHREEAQEQAFQISVDLLHEHKNIPLGITNIISKF